MSAADPSRAAPLAGSSSGTQNQQDLMHQQRVWGWIFLSPWIIGFTLLTAMPILFSFVLTFTDFTLTKPNEVNFVGLQNWSRLLQDPQAIDAIGVTLRFALIAVPIGLLVPLSMALLLNAKRLWGKRFFRTLFYLPYMVPAVSSIFIWMSFLNGQTGWLNRILRIANVTDPPNWLQDQNT